MSVATEHHVSAMRQNIEELRGLEGAPLGATDVLLTTLITIVSHGFTMLTHAVEADAADTEADPDLFWGRVELFGHAVRYGQVRDVRMFGRRFVEIREPEIENPHYGASDRLAEPAVFPEVVKRYHPNAVYAIQEQTEDEVMGTLRRTRGIYLGDDEGLNPTRTSPDEDDLPL